MTMTCCKSLVLILPGLPLLQPALEGTGDKFLDIGDDLLDLEDDLLDAENDLLQELDLAHRQPDSGTTTTKRKGRQPGSRNKKTLQREIAIMGAMYMQRALSEDVDVTVHSSEVIISTKSETFEYIESRRDLPLLELYFLKTSCIMLKVG
ncbi:hypothetical protein V8E54_001687 [Elaphomyces granulatus]